MESKLRLLDQLSKSPTPFSKSGRLIADCVLADPACVTGMSIAVLARAAGVSEPTVNRFCTGLGLRGFPDFKMKLAAELARDTPGVTRDIHADDSTAQVIDKIFDGARTSLQATRRDLTAAVVEAAVEQLAQARAIVLCGQGASASVALDAQHKLMIFGTPVIAHVDVLQQRMCASSLGPADCLVCVSYTGRTIGMVEVAALGREAGAQVIGITAPGSALAAVCHLVLPVAAGEDTDVYVPMSSRISQLALIDVLVTALALRKGPAFQARLRELKRNVLATRSSARRVPAATEFDQQGMLQ